MLPVPLLRVIHAGQVPQRAAGPLGDCNPADMAFYFSAFRMLHVDPEAFGISEQFRASSTSIALSKIAPASRFFHFLHLTSARLT